MFRIWPLLFFVTGCSDSSSIGKPPLGEDTVELFCPTDAGKMHIELDNQRCPGRTTQAPWQSDGCEGTGCVTACCSVDDCLADAPKDLDETDIACEEHICQPASGFVQRITERRCND